MFQTQKQKDDARMESILHMQQKVLSFIKEFVVNEKISNL